MTVNNRFFPISTSIAFICATSRNHINVTNQAEILRVKFSNVIYFNTHVLWEKLSQTAHKKFDKHLKFIYLVNLLQVAYFYPFKCEIWWSPLFTIITEHYFVCYTGDDQRCCLNFYQSVWCICKILVNCNNARGTRSLCSYTRVCSILRMYSIPNYIEWWKYCETGRSTGV